MEGEAHAQEDLATLSDLDEESLLESLTARFNHRHIYVSNAPCLLAWLIFRNILQYVGHFRVLSRRVHSTASSVCVFKTCILFIIIIVMVLVT